MTMNLRNLAAGVLALAGLAFATPARAEDNFRLGLPGSDKAPTSNLKATDDDLDAEVLDIARGRGGVGRGGRGFARGGRGFARGGRGFRGAFFRSGFRRGWGGRGFGWGGRGWGWGGRGYGFAYYPRYYGGFYYGAPRVYYSGPAGYVYGYAPCSGTVISSVPAATLRMAPVPSNGAPSVPSTPAPGKNTYPYDGGPKAPVPMPQAEEARQVPLPRTPALLEEVLVSLEGQGGKWNYPAYGEKATRGGSGSVLRSAGISGNFR
jgi:hypothetical protein